jgi:hypothetical protein
VRELENLIDAELREQYPFYYDLLVYKMDGLTNTEIQQKLLEKYGNTHTTEYLSSLWCNKIPKLLAEKAQEKYVTWYYTNVEYGKWKKCNKCGEIKLAHPIFFSRNSGSKDGFYSVCKDCRNKSYRIKLQ